MTSLPRERWPSNEEKDAETLLLQIDDEGESSNHRRRSYRDTMASTRRNNHSLPESWPSQEYTTAALERLEEPFLLPAVQDDEVNNNRRLQSTFISKPLLNFLWMSVLFSASHGCVVACLALASARLGRVGAWQSGVLYLMYTGCAVFGLGTYLVQGPLGARNTLLVGMVLYGVYVGAFWVTEDLQADTRAMVALAGAGIGGTGASLLWVAQGAYFVRAANAHAAAQEHQSEDSARATLASLFAFVYLVGEVVLRVLSTLLIQVAKLDWAAVFGVYGLVSLLSTLGMCLIEDYRDDKEDEQGNRDTSPRQSCFYKVTAAWQVLYHDPKMKYMIGMNAVCGFCMAFVNSFVNGEVVRVVLDDYDVGLLTGGMALVAAALSLVFGPLSKMIGNGPILILGALSFLSVAAAFLILPEIEHWTWVHLVLLYTVYGCGRATFEGPLKAAFGNFFAKDSEGAFANIVLQNGLSSAIGYVLTYSIPCSDGSSSRHCARYSDGTLHNVATLEWTIVGLAVVAIAGYWRASILHEREQMAASATRSSTRNGQAV